MNLDFSLILVVLTSMAGAVWVLDALLLAPRRKKVLLMAESKGSDIPASTQEDLLREPSWVEFARSVFPVLAIVLLLRSFLFEPFKIPSGSMIPTLEVGDFILVNKFHYGLRLPVINTRFFAVNDPQPGEVAVFRYPENPSIYYIKRVIGSPGDKISYINKQLYVNDEQVPTELLARMPPVNPQQFLFKETIGEHEHRIQLLTRAVPFNNSWEVPEGQFFVMGDNRDNSNDSRAWGFVPEENMVGKAVVVWMHWERLLSLPDFTAMRLIK